MSGPPSASRRMSRSGIVLAALPAVALAALTFLVTRPITPHGADATAGASRAATVGIAVGDRAPDFVRSDGQAELIGLDHKPIRLADFAGHPLWIVFWATWCTPCQEEAADIQALYRAHSGSGLAVLAIDVQDPESSVRDFMAEHALDYTVGLDSTAAVQAQFGGWALPVHYFLDGSGRIRDRYIGQLSGDGMTQHLGSILGSASSALSR